MDRYGGNFGALLWILTIVSCADATAGNLPLWDGEAAYTCEYGAPNATEAFRGRACFEATPDAYHEPRICLNGLPSWRADLSGYDEIWFFAKCSESGKTFDFSVTGYPNASNHVNIDAYIQDGALDTTYRLVRIPLSALKTPEYALNPVENLRFGVAKPSPGHRIYIDEVWTVDLTIVDPAETPLVGALPPVRFGEISVGERREVSFSVTNCGRAPLQVAAADLSGADAAEFSITPAAFTVPLGQTVPVKATFAPVSPGDKAVTAALSHNATVLGSTTQLVMDGQGVGASIRVSPACLEFGAVPVGSEATWTLVVSNEGNRDLHVSPVSSSSPLFGVLPDAVTVPPGGRGEVAVTFRPARPGKLVETLALASDDSTRPAIDVGLAGEAIAANGGNSRLDISVDRVTSGSVSFSWPRFSGADSVRVSIRADPWEEAGAVPPDAETVATLPGTASKYTVDKLAAAVDVFIFVEARAGVDILAAGQAHARTVGGPRALLDTPVREVHLCAPNILEIVLANPKVTSYSGTGGALVGYTGPRWQSGPWRVSRRDGSPMGVTRVYRHSIPVGQPYYELGYGTSTHDELVDVDHHIFLVLDGPVGAGDVLHVQGPFDAGFLLPFSDRYLETGVIQVNQAGYCPRATRRYAYVSGWLGDGGPLTLTDFPDAAEVIVEPEDAALPRTTAASGLAISVRSEHDEDAGGEVREIDLASVPPAEGVVYRVRIPGVGVSWPTQVSETALFKAFYTAARGLYYNRWGRDLRPECTAWGPRPPDHPTVFTGELRDAQGNPAFGFGPTAMFSKTTRQTGERVLAGGHHNAGDFDIQLSDHVVAMMLLRLYEINAAAFTDGQLTVPESGNGIPDLLDEALWSLAAWEDLQEADGGVRAGVESWREPWGIYHADEDPLPYWTYSRHTMHTLRVAGLFAQAARLVAPFSAAKSEELRTRAVRAYDYAVAYGAGQNARGPMLYAAGELFRLTGETRYRDLFESTWRVEDKYGTGPGMYAFLPEASAYYEPKQPIVADHVLGYLGSAGADPAFVEAAVKRITVMADEALHDLDSLHAYRNGRSLSPSWGKGTAVGEFMMRIYARIQLGGLPPATWQQYFDAMSLSADYVLGGNPEGEVWLTGLGSRHPEDPLHLDSLAFIKEGQEAVPGFPVFGPTKGISGMAYYDYGKNVFYPPFLDHPLMHRYADIHTFVTNSEGGSQMAAVHTELFGMLLATGMTPPASWLPGGKEHKSSLAPRESAVSRTPGQEAAGVTTAATAMRNGAPDVDRGGEGVRQTPGGPKDARLRHSAERSSGSGAEDKHAPLRRNPAP